jgi:alginate O-acetyltransferase complex protein AlgI
MLFNTPQFLFIYLPITVLGFYIIGVRGHHQIALSWLVGASFFFYGWWNPAYVSLLLGSILFNYAVGISLSENRRKGTLIVGVAANLGLLIYFKYTNFFVDNINALIGSDIVFDQIILPLAISFFTFQQITYLVDSYSGEAEEHSFLHYCVFVTFFPQLIIGPIVHHREMLPQFAKDTIYKLKTENITLGLTLVIIGLFKKMVIADGVANYASPIFGVAESGGNLAFFAAWGGALAYTFQLYFDFSGYSDTAIGLARMFGIVLPTNFFSPYKAHNVAEFWRRWHMTLSRLIRDYLYYPVTLLLTRYANSSHCGPISRFILIVLSPIIFTFFWMGLWHGAGWTFVVFGLVHGSYLVSYHLWVEYKRHNPSIKVIKSPAVAYTFGQVVTFLAASASFVIFRSESMSGASTMLQAMLGINGFSIPELIDFQLIAVLCFLLFIVCFMPSTQEFLQKFQPALNIYSGKAAPQRYHWFLQYRPRNWAHNFLIIMMAWMIILAILSNRPTEFLYFNF